MPEERRHSLTARRTHVRAQKHHSTFPSSIPTPPRTLDRLIVGLGYAGLATYMYSNLKKLSTYEFAGIAVGSLTLGYGLFDLGKRNGMMQGASFALRRGERAGERLDEELDDEESWKGELRGQEFEDLLVAEKIAWLRGEQKRIQDLQEDEQLMCGQAYIAKEGAYLEYEKRGEYGGPNWKIYAEADKECQERYAEYERQQKRLRAIWKEINDLNGKL